MADEGIAIWFRAARITMMPMAAGFLNSCRELR